MRNRLLFVLLCVYTLISSVCLITAYKSYKLTKEQSSFLYTTETNVVIERMNPPVGKQASVIDTVLYLKDLDNLLIKDSSITSIWVKF